MTALIKPNDNPKLPAALSVVKVEAGPDSCALRVITIDAGPAREVLVHLSMREAWLLSQELTRWCKRVYGDKV